MLQGDTILSLGDNFMAADSRWENICGEAAKIFQLPEIIASSGWSHHQHLSVDSPATVHCQLGHYVYSSGLFHSMQITVAWQLIIVSASFNNYKITNGFQTTNRQVLPVTNLLKTSFLVTKFNEILTIRWKLPWPMFYHWSTLTPRILSPPIIRIFNLITLRVY